MSWRKHIQILDNRRNVAVPGDLDQTVIYCVEQFIDIANEAIETKGKFYVALSGGSTPKVIFEKLANKPYRDQISWEHVYLFWSDERCVPPNDPNSNYHMAMQAGLDTLSINPKHVYRMAGEAYPEDAAKEYDRWIRDVVPDQSFDLVMLGVGDDGHTASLFPETHGLHAIDRYAIANYVSQKNTWRLSLTFECINNAKNISIYLLGKNKAPIFKKVILSPENPDELPVQRVGTAKHKALWILDKDAANNTLTDNL